MKVIAVLLLVAVMQIALTTGQTKSAYARRQGNLRRNGAVTAAQKRSSDSSSSSILPSFITRAFGGGSETPKRSGTSGRNGGPRPAGGRGRSKKTRAPNRRPLGATSLVNFAGGRFAGGGGGFPRRRLALENAAAQQVSGIPQLALAASRVAPVTAHVHTLPASVRLATPPQSLEGWLSYPTEAPRVTTAKYTPTVANNKAGTCGSTQSYGIKCRERMDQCSIDAHCPGATRCCMVGDCGYLCVKPKATSEDEKKKWGVASNVLKRQREAEGQVIEMSTTATGLKLDDIADHKLKIQQ